MTQMLKERSVAEGDGDHEKSFADGQCQTDETAPVPTVPPDGAAPRSALEGSRQPGPRSPESQLDTTEDQMPTMAFSAPAVRPAQAPAARTRNDRAGGTERARSHGPTVAPRRSTRNGGHPPPVAAPPRRARTVTVFSPPRDPVRSPPRAPDGDEMVEMPGIIHHRPALQPWKEPSRSTRRPTHVLSRAELSLDGSAPRTRLQEILRERHEGNLETRTKFPGRQGPAELLVSAEARIQGARSGGRQDALSGGYKAFLAWCALVEEPGSTLAMEWRVICYVESKLVANAPPGLTKEQLTAQGYIVNSTAVKTIKNLKQSLFESGHGTHLDGPTLDMYKTSLEKAGMKPVQAPPATLEEVVKTLELLTPDERVGMMLAWLCAARLGEIAPLRKENVVAIQSDPCILAVTFPESKADLHKLGVAMVTYPGAWTLEILEHLAALGPGAQVSSLTTERAAAILARVNPTLSAHSVKRGALTTLLRANVPLSIIQTIAKHRDLEMTFLYLPRVEVALHLGLHEASRVLAPT